MMTTLPWRSRPAIIMAFVMALLLAACGDSQPPAGSDAAVADSQSGDGATPTPDTKPLGAWTFTPDAPQGGQATSVDIVAASIEGDKATLELRVRGVAQLQGVAFRLRYDAARVSIGTTERASAWGAQQVVDRFAARDAPGEKLDGELWGGIGYLGPRGLAASAQTVLARVQVTLSGADPIHVDFRPAHNVLLTPELRSLPAEWLGGTFSRK
ncbi:MAG: hypothetical protein KC503_23405 [Myxococcales bacterium]|nr:hypothetical protein [Myxococcales bacterium]